jgi:uncharacterized protein (TIGR00255 family)
VTVRTVNHKFLDMSLRLPDEVRQHEGRIREQIGTFLTRGRVDCRFDVEDFRDHDTQVELNQDLVDELAESIRRWNEQGVVIAELSLRDLLRIPDAIRVKTTHADADPTMLEEIFRTLDEALTKTQHSRVVEGRKLQKKISNLLDKMSEKIAELEAEERRVSNELADRFKQRLEELDIGETRLDDGRVAQEIALLIDRTDIREELDRLRTHVDHFNIALGTDGPVGRRLDFLAQEMFRELTTLATKCRHTSVTQPAIDGKLICEQIREQVQNLE